MDVQLFDHGKNGEPVDSKPPLRNEMSRECLPQSESQQYQNESQGFFSPFRRLYSFFSNLGSFREFHQLFLLFNLLFVVGIAFVYFFWLGIFTLLPSGLSEGFSIAYNYILGFESLVFVFHLLGCAYRLVFTIIIYLSHLERIVKGGILFAYEYPYIDTERLNQVPCNCADTLYGVFLAVACFFIVAACVYLFRKKSSSTTVKKYKIL